jgi:hypothetical protein
LIEERKRGHLGRVGIVSIPFYPVCPKMVFVEKPIICKIKTNVDI